MACPEDISVIGYDDDFRAAVSSPALTTIKVPVYDLAQRSAEVLLEHLMSDNPASKFPNSVTWIPVELVVRRSTKMRSE